LFSSKGDVNGRSESERKNPADGGGLFYFAPTLFRPDSAEDAKITATKHNFVPGQITVTGP
jgi:hypothetical protein